MISVNNDEPAFEEILAYGRAIRQGDESVLDLEDGRFKK